MEFKGSILSVQWLFLFVSVAFISKGEGLNQKLWLYDVNKNGIQLNSPAASLSDFASFLPKVTTACTSGLWTIHESENFGTNVNNTNTLLGFPRNTSIICKSVNATNFKSLRHIGANDTDLDTLSLYSGYWWSEQVILVTARAMTGITSRPRYYAATGNSDWMLFEGQNLDGNSRCYRVPYLDWFIEYGQIQILNTVGSVFKGCDLLEIEAYRKQHSL